ncbi:hypothetical protein PMNALOAF_2402 [Methylobacterium adhaesivum]|uniref:Class I SAM-dependent methyltransferase n=1 Tax=Methylobacterium adhaesivum TaxID=333297 RepID=A0ABT8BIE7_9HYPH|nr:hypothetical protein [Methylobacterium adhaesivum]MDN3591584.1 hypothetical protein [Methylobacterium adhaesivum]GJD31149.1 hypothetical protein PMNALOAF_2402 [Methylobacterium adhaesivum]
MPPLNGRYPEFLLAERARAAASTDLRERARYDVEARPFYLFGLLTAADVARFSGIDHVAAIEFGVAEGAGLRALSDLAAKVTALTGVRFTIYGFDTGAGLPPLVDVRDHPEIWQAGDFPTRDPESLSQHATMVWGDIGETLPVFVEALTPAMPVGFVSIDVDIYRSSVDCLRLFSDAKAECLLPVVPSYFDDTIGGPARIGSLFRNRWCGQLLAIDEFNARAAVPRKIDTLRTLRYRRPFADEPWLEQMYGLHVLDHPLRQPGATRPALSIGGHAAEDRMTWPL